MGSPRNSKAVVVEVVEPGRLREITLALSNAGLSRSDARKTAQYVLGVLRNSIVSSIVADENQAEVVKEAMGPTSAQVGFYIGVVCIEKPQSVCIRLRPRYDWVWSALRDAKRAYDRFGIPLVVKIPGFPSLTVGPNPVYIHAAINEVEEFLDRVDIEPEVKAVTLDLALTLIASKAAGVIRAYAGLETLYKLDALKAAIVRVAARLQRVTLDEELVDEDVVQKVAVLTSTGVSLAYSGLSYLLLIPTPRIYEAFLHAEVARIVEELGWRLSGIRRDARSGCTSIVFDKQGEELVLHLNCVPARLSRIVCKFTSRGNACKTPRPDATLELRSLVLVLEAKYRELNGTKLSRWDAMRIAAYIADVARNERLTAIVTHVGEYVEPLKHESSIDGESIEVIVTPLTPRQRRHFQHIIESKIEAS